ncbi:MAG: DUF4332 domain-containing protein [Pirellulaceae bacterium]
MSRILKILRAAHCRSTHHYFAIDALQHIETAQGRRLADLLLKYHTEYLLGAKAPDKTFRDFQNHVIHVSDGNWGGAPRACEKWLCEALEHLDNQRWKKAAYALGVLSHYFTDPIMPLHTGQTERESIIHRPLEWSVCKSYQSIYDQLDHEQIQVSFTLAIGPKWVSRAVLSAAAVAHQHYQRLMEIYDLEPGCRNPPQGLNQEAREILCELFGVALTGWAQVLSRIADETVVELPETSLGLASVLATIDMPMAWILKKFTDRSEKRAVQALFEEYERTGTVRKHLPPEVNVVSKHRLLDTEHTERLAAQKSQTRDRSENNSASHKLSQERRRLDQVVLPDEQSSPEPRHRNDIETFQPALGAPAAMPVAATPAPSTSSVHSPVDTLTDTWTEEAGGLNLSSDLVDAPSIGPKTAKRFQKIGIQTIGQFLAADPVTMVAKLETRWITRQLLEEWQAQARLVCEVQALCGYKAQLLVAAGCYSTAHLASSSLAALSVRIEEISDSSEGKRILRSSPTPGIDQVAEWITCAQRSQQAKRSAA